MTHPSLTNEVRNASPAKMPRIKSLFLAALAPGALGGCVQVSAPERPIEINLNINIRQEVVVRLQEDVRELIRSNPGVF